MILTLLRCATAIGRKLGELLVTARAGGRCAPERTHARVGEGHDLELELITIGVVCDFTAQAGTAQHGYGTSRNGAAWIRHKQERRSMELGVEDLMECLECGDASVAAVGGRAHVPTL
jgi:hypothetical protein